MKLDALYNILVVTNYILSIIGVAIILYLCFIFCLITFTLARTKQLTAIKILHIFSVVEIYCIVCFLIAILFVAKIKGLLILKVILFGLVVIFNGITATRLLAKTAFFYNLRFKKSTKSLQPKEAK